MLESRTSQRPKDERHLLDTGELLDNRYRLLRRIGGGGYGEVYAVEHVQLNKKFALKVLSRQLSERSKMIERFRREAMATSQIDHPNIVSLTDFGRLITGQVYYVMELLEGITVADLLDREGTLRLSRAIPILAATCHALAASHKAGIVHRDLKPANIFLAEIEDIQHGVKRDLVKILDFGFAKVVQEHPDNTQLSTEGVAFGTPGYMAPEQLQGKEITSRVDIYAIGCLAFEMFAGKQVFSGSPMAVAMAHCERPAPLVRERNPEAQLPDRMEQLIDRCLRKDPEARPQSCLEVLDELRELTRNLLTPEGKTLVGDFGEGVEDSDSWRSIDTDKQQWWEDMSITLQQPRGLVSSSEEVIIPSSEMQATQAEPNPESDEVTVRQDPADFLSNVMPPPGPAARPGVLGNLRPPEELLPPDDLGPRDFEAAVAPRTGRQVLLVESDPTFADEVRSDLRRHGCRVEWLSDGENTLQIVEQDPPDLIILSVELERMSGYAICSRLKQTPATKGIPLILYSSEATEEHFEKHKKLPTRAEAYLLRPFSHEDLRAKVDALTGRPATAGAETVEVPEVQRSAAAVAETAPVKVAAQAKTRPSATTETISAVDEPPEAQRMDRYLIVGLSAATVAVLGFTLYFLLKNNGAEGALILQVRPAEATLLLNGRKIDEAGDTRILADLPTGEKELTVAYPGCETVKKKVKVRSGKVAVAKIRLRCAAEP